GSGPTRATSAAAAATASSTPSRSPPRTRRARSAGASTAAPSSSGLGSKPPPPNAASRPQSGARRRLGAVRHPLPLRDDAVDQNRRGRAPELVGVPPEARLAGARAAVLAAERDLPLPPAAPAHLLEHRERQIFLTRRVDERWRLAEHLLLGPAEEPLGARVPVEDPALEVEDEDRVEDVLEGARLLAQDLLHPPPVGDVPEAPDPADDPPVDPLRARVTLEDAPFLDLHPAEAL